MGRPLVLSALACFFLPLVGTPQETPKPPAPAPDNYRNEAMVFERSETTYRMHADGTGERDIHVFLRLQSQGAAQQFGVLSFGYASAYETPHIRLVRVHKPDGSTVDTPASDAIDMPAAVSREAPLYSDLKEKHLPVRSLSAGDTLEYDFQTTIDKAEAPNQFWGADHFTAPGTVVVLAETLNLEVPADKYVQVWSPNHKPTISDHDGLRTYSWNVAQLVTAPKPPADGSPTPEAPKDIDEDADGRKLPSVAWTTFRNWAEVGDWYRSLALTQADPTDPIRARAAELTKDAKTPEDQARALYAFVSDHIRYVGIDFGVGRYQPHPAAEVLANQYGDCKDKDTLLEALLRAKGFSTAPALIGAGIAPVPDVPSPAVFNHVITTVNLPDGRIWLDSTPSVAPYRLLNSVIRDQKALVVPASAPAELIATPAAAPYPFTEHFSADASLDADGKLTGKITATYRDDNEVVLRALAHGFAPAEWDKASQYVSSSTGFSGTTSNTQFTNADDLASPIAISYDYARHPYGDWKMLNIVPLLPQPEFITLDSDSTPPQEDIQLGAPRTLTGVSRIRLPEGYRADPPDPIHVKTDFATFDKTYRFVDGQVIVERTVVILKKKIAKQDWKKYQDFTTAIRLTDEPWIPLIPPSKEVTTKTQSPPGSTTGADSSSTTNTARSDKAAPSQTLSVHSMPGPSPKPGTTTDTSTSNASIADLMMDVYTRLRAGDPGGAKEVLDKVKAKNPDQENLWTMYGGIAQLERDDDEAEADFRKEIAAHPDNPMAVFALTGVEFKKGDSLAARQTLRQFLDHHPENQQASLYLASLQTTALDYTGALKTLEAASAQSPDDHGIRVQISATLVHLHRNEEAAAAAKSALDGSDDPGVLNDAAYELSETGIDLPVAEDASRKSIDKLEEKSATMAAAEANSRTFAEANLLIASWDTLGWILFREGKLDQAQPLLSAAWRASLRAEIGDHLGQVDEALGQKDEALTMYSLASTALTKNDTPDVRGHIKDSITRLNAAGAKVQRPTNTDALQNMRTYHVAKTSGAGGWGTFRLEITTAGVIDSQQMSGEKQIAALKPAIDAMKFPELLPPGSKAHLLRSAVVSCSAGSFCEVILVPDGGLQTEQP